MQNSAPGSHAHLRLTTLLRIQETYPQPVFIITMVTQAPFAGGVRRSTLVSDWLQLLVGFDPLQWHKSAKTAAPNQKQLAWGQLQAWMLSNPYSGW